MVIGLVADAGLFYLQAKEYKDDFAPFLVKFMLSTALLAFPTPLSPVVFFAMSFLGHDQTEKMGLFAEQSKKDAKVSPDLAAQKTIGDTKKDEPTQSDSSHPPLDDSTDDSKLPPYKM